MCINCWHELGSPKINNEKVIKAHELIRKLYATPDGGAGGVGHVVFDDWNTDSVKYCLAECDKDWAKWMCQETIDASREALEHCSNMTEEEIGAALALNRFWKPE